MNKHILPKLPYGYDALEPHIDARTMEIHYSKHHQTYCDKLNTALDKYPELFDTPVEILLKDLSTVPEDIELAVRNNGGGFVNHSLFWNIMTPDVKSREMKGKIINDIKKTFGSFDEFKKQFSDAAMGRFGSGWAWLVLNGKKLEIMSTANQDSPISEGKKPLLCIDVWEHAYYFKYQNKRADYVSNWWNVVNWNKVNEIYEQATAKK